MENEKEYDKEGNGYEKIKGSPLPEDANHNLETQTLEQHTDGVSVQCLVRGDKVFSLTWMEGGTWSAFIGGQWKKKNCKFVTGEVIVNKDWCEAKLSLQVRWENGNVEKLKQKSCEVAYGDRIFVLDRKCIYPGSKVSLISHPELEGTVLAKRHLATGSTTSTKTPEYVFEDIDVNMLRRENHGNGYKDNKVLYRGWLGVTSGYRTRIYMQSQTYDGAFFTIAVAGHVAQNLNIGDEINLGFRILRGADFVGGETGSSNWLVNFFKFYNTNATVVDFEIDQLFVCWIGKAANPTVLPTEYELNEAPDDVIQYEELCNVNYLWGDVHHHVTPQSLWVYQCSKDDHPLSKEQWARKWLKVIDWDRWEYPGTDANDDVQPVFGSKHLTLQIMFIRTVVEVLWNNGTISTVNCGDIIPLNLGSVWSDMMRFHTGSIVKNCTEFTNKHKYGIITSLVEHNNAIVKWITPEHHLTRHNGDSTPCTKISTESLYNLTEVPEYEYILMPNQCPIVNCGQNGKIGVVVGTKPEDFTVRVKLVNQIEEAYWPHELTHYKCDVLLCPVENRWTLWYAHMVPPSGIVEVGPDLTSDFSLSFDDLPKTMTTTSSSLNLSCGALPKKFECIEKVPRDNLFVNEEIRPRTRETNFHHAMEEEIAELEKNLPEGMWVHHYTGRGDIFSAVLTGPKESIFEDFLFVFDIFIMEDFPRSGPHMNFRSMGLTLIPGHLCKSGALFLPEDTRLLEEDLSPSSILNILLEMKDFLGIPLEVIHEKNKLDTVGIRPEDPLELQKFVTLAVLDYAITLLKNPPINWRPVIVNHFAKVLPSIIGRFKTGGIEVKRATATLSNEKGDLPKPEEYQKITIPWDEGFLKTVNSRLVQLENICSSIME